MAQRGVNKVIVVGNAGKDTELRHTQSGNPVGSVNIATSETWKDKQTGHTQEKTEWHKIVIFGKLAEIAAQYLKKGAKVYFEGRLATRKYTPQDGIERYVTEIIVDQNGTMQLLDGPNRGADNGQGNGYQNHQQSQQQPQQQQRPNNHQQQQNQQQPQGGYNGQSQQRQQPQQQYQEPHGGQPNNYDFDPMDDDIPFG